MHVILTALDPALADAWQRHCGAYGFVSIERRSILEVEADALVSPANSFGFMDGGIDRRYLDHFGVGLQDTVQALIRAHYHGEMPVGLADVVETGDDRHPYLIVAPTMRVPTPLHQSANPFLAARAVFLLLRHGRFRDGPHAGERIGDFITHVAFPGLGTGIGELDPDVCARQMRAAIETVLIGAVPFPTSWVQAADRHERMVT